eukprot:CAMPEP_0119514664 /NCGR_PEP_ID=MMETSP1344-20130328/32421_1 /TAXON_ID=236787 /ORGANISM="Florenciella parvula, Strain CCMP2471" /LENGTH=234 /DNA_ID=CAMNT_0007552003 /DNA_START=57 /DNA_END=757 /DNA_ORIENTATION=+
MSYQTSLPDERAQYESIDTRFFQVDEVPSASDIAATPARRQRLAVRSVVIGGVVVLCGFVGKAALQGGTTTPAMNLDAGSGMGDGAIANAGMGNGVGALDPEDEDDYFYDYVDGTFHHPFVYCKSLFGLCKKVQNDKICTGDDDEGIHNAWNICGDYNESMPSSACYLTCTKLKYTCEYKKDKLCPIAPSASPTEGPSSPPTGAPTYTPTPAPTPEPTYAPTPAPTPEPTEYPT